MRNLKETNHAEESLIVGSMTVLHDISGAGFETIKSEVKQITNSVSALKSSQDDYWSRLSEDGIITANEKKMLRKEWAAIYQTYSSILSVATAKGFINMAEITSYRGAYASLDQLINTDLKLFDDMTSDTQIEDRITFNAAYSTYYAAESLAQFGISSGLIGNLGFKALSSLEDPGEEGDVGLYQGEFYQYKNGIWLKVGLEGYQGKKTSLPNGIENQYFLVSDDFLGQVRISVNNKILKVNGKELWISRVFEKGYIYAYLNSKWVKIEDTYDFRYTVAMVDYYEVTRKLPPMFQEQIDGLAGRIDDAENDISQLQRADQTINSQIEQHYGELTVINGKVVVIDRNLGKYGSGGTGDIEQDIDSKLETSDYHIPINYGAISSTGSIPSDPGEGDYFVWTGTSGATYVNSICYVYSKDTQSWTALNATDSRNGGYYMTNLYAILQANNAGPGYFSALFAAALYSNSAWINELHAQIVNIGEYGSIVTEDYIAGASFDRDGKITPTGIGQGFLIADASADGTPARIDVNGPAHFKNAWMEGTVHAKEFMVVDPAGNLRNWSIDDLSGASDLAKQTDIAGFITKDALRQGSYAACTSAASATALTAVLDNFTLNTNISILIELSNGSTNTADRTLNVNNTGDCPLFLKGSRDKTVDPGFFKITYTAGAWYLTGITVTSADTAASVTTSAGTVISGENLATQDDILDFITTDDLSNGDYAVCSTGSTATALTATLKNFNLIANVTILIYFDNANTLTSNRTLNVNGTGAKNLYIGGSRSNKLTAGLYRATYKTGSAAGWYVYSVAVSQADKASAADGVKTSAGIITGDNIASQDDISDFITAEDLSNGSYAICESAATATALTASLDNFNLMANTSILIDFVYGNSIAKNRTLNVNKTGDKPLFVLGSRTEVFTAGIYKISYNGTSWYLTQITVSNAKTADAAEGIKTSGGKILTAADIAKSTDILDFITTKDLSNGDYAVCSTGASETALTAELKNFNLIANTTVLIYFENGSSITADRTLSVNGTDKKYLYVAGSRSGKLTAGLYRATYRTGSAEGWYIYTLSVSSANTASTAGQAEIAAGITMQDGSTLTGDDIATQDDISDFVTTDQLTPGSYAVCTDDPATTALTAQLANYSLMENTSILIYFEKGSTVKNNRTLNVNLTGDKALNVLGDPMATFSPGFYKISYKNETWNMSEITVTNAEYADESKTTSKIKAADGTLLTAEQLAKQTDILDFITEKDLPKGSYAVCNSSATATKLAVTFENFNLVANATILIYFANGSTITTNRTLSLNGGTEKNLYIANKRNAKFSEGLYRAIYRTSGSYIGWNLYTVTVSKAEESSHAGSADQAGVTDKVNTKAGQITGDEIATQDDLSDFVTYSELTPGSYAECTQAGNKTALTAVLKGFVLADNISILIYFNEDSTISETRTLDVNGTGPKNLYVGTSSNESFKAGFYKASYRGAAWYLSQIQVSNAVTSSVAQGVLTSAGGIVTADQIATQGDINDFITKKDIPNGSYAICDSEATANKLVATMANFSLIANATILIYFSNGSAIASDRFLNVNETGDKKLWLNNSRSKTFSAGLYRVMYKSSGTYAGWNLFTVNVETAGSASTAGHADTAGSASTAGHAATAGSASTAGHADTAGSADNANNIVTASGVISGDDIATQDDLSDYVLMDDLVPGSYAECLEAGTNTELTATLDNYSLVENMSILIYFEQGSTTKQTRTLDVNETGPKTLYILGRTDNIFSPGFYKIIYRNETWNMSEITVTNADHADNADEADHAQESTNTKGGTVQQTTMYDNSTGSNGSTEEEEGDTSLAYSTGDFDNQDPENSTGFGIRRNGDAFFNNGYFRGHIEAKSGTFEGNLQCGQIVTEIDKLTFIYTETITGSKLKSIIKDLNMPSSMAYFDDYIKNSSNANIVKNNDFVKHALLETTLSGRTIIITAIYNTSYKDFTYKYYLKNDPFKIIYDGHIVNLQDSSEFGTNSKFYYTMEDLMVMTFNNIPLDKPTRKNSLYIDNGILKIS